MTLPVAWIPGHMCGAWLYAPQLAATVGRPAIVADVTRDADLGAMAERLLAAAPGRFVLAGLSMGAMVAMEAMARAPERIAGALLMDTDPAPAREKEKAWRAARLAEGVEAYVAAFVPRFFAHDAGAAARLGPQVMAAAAACPAEVVAAQARALDGRRDMIPALQGFSAPVEIVVGAEDRVCPPKLHAPLAEALPGAALAEIPRCGHLATLEAPAAVNARLAALLERAR